MVRINGEIQTYLKIHFPARKLTELAVFQPYNKLSMNTFFNFGTKVPPPYAPEPSGAKAIISFL